MNLWKMAEYHCPECGQITNKPPWLIAREKGFISGEHCIIMANRFGKVMKCIHAGTVIKKGEFHRIEGLKVCDQCRIYQHFTRTIVDKFGREHIVFHNPEGGNGETNNPEMS